jgi:RNA:NAD 2'-phosphotransferase (TPT1/KptA family)
MSYFLRVGAAMHGYHWRADGFVLVDDVIHFLNNQGLQRRRRTMIQVGDVLKEVLCNEKKRFQALREDGVCSFVRACGGHSSPFLVDDSLLFSETLEEDVEFLYHGTFQKQLESILLEGLIPGGKRRGSRTHVFFSPHPTGDERNIGGQRFEAPLIIKVSAALLRELGIVVYKTSNFAYVTVSVVPPRAIVWMFTVEQGSRCIRDLLAQAPPAPPLSLHPPPPLPAPWL